MWIFWWNILSILSFDYLKLVQKFFQEHYQNTTLPHPSQGTKNPLVTKSEIQKGRVILPIALVLHHSRTSALGRITGGSHITYYTLMFFIAYTFKGQVHVFAGQANCKSLGLQDECNIEIFLSPTPSSS